VAAATVAMIWMIELLEGDFDYEMIVVSTLIVAVVAGVYELRTRFWQRVFPPLSAEARTASRPPSPAGVAVLLGSQILMPIAVGIVAGIAFDDFLFFFGTGLILSLAGLSIIQVLWPMLRDRFK
jgi:hypothetical protein